MSSTLRSTRRRTGGSAAAIVAGAAGAAGSTLSSALVASSDGSSVAQAIAAAAALNASLVLFDKLMGVPDYREVVTGQLDTVLLSRFRVSRRLRAWIDPILAARGVAHADVAAIHVRVLHHLCSIPHREIRLAQSEYAVMGDATNAEHLSTEPRGEVTEGCSSGEPPRTTIQTRAAAAALDAGVARGLRVAADR